MVVGFMLDFSSIKESRLIIKANILIETPNPLTTFEHRLLLCALSQIDSGDKEFKPVNIYIPDFRRVVGVSQGYNNHVIQEKLDEFQKKGMALNASNIEIDVGEIERIPWFQSAVVDYSKSEINIIFNPRLRSHLIELKANFTRYPLQNVIRFKNKYSFKIYDLLKQYENFGFRLMELQKLRYWLGIPDTEYQVFKNFKNRVLEPVQEEINTHTDLSFGFDLINRGRRIIGLKFIIRRPSRKVEADDAFKRLLNEISVENKEKKTIQDIVYRYYRKYGGEYVARNIRYTNLNSKGSYRGFLAFSLKNDWGLVLEEDELDRYRKRQEQSKINQEIEDEEAVERLAQEQKKQAQLDKFYRLSDIEQQKIEAEIDRGNHFLRRLPRETRLWIWMSENC